MRHWVEGTTPPCWKCVYNDDHDLCMQAACEIDFENNRCTYFDQSKVRGDKTFASICIALKKVRKRPKINELVSGYSCVTHTNYKHHVLRADTKGELLDKWLKTMREEEHRRLRAGSYIKKYGFRWRMVYKEQAKNFDTKAEAVEFCMSLIDFFYKAC